MTGARLAMHLWIYRRSHWYRWAWAWHVSFGLLRLTGHSRMEALASILGHKYCGHRMYYYPRARREVMRGLPDGR